MYNLCDLLLLIFELEGKFIKYRNIIIKGINNINKNLKRTSSFGLLLKLILILFLFTEESYKKNYNL